MKKVLRSVADFKRVMVLEKIVFISSVQLLILILSWALTMYWAWTGKEVNVHHKESQGHGHGHRCPFSLVWQQLDKRCVISSVWELHARFRCTLYMYLCSHILRYLCTYNLNKLVRLYVINQPICQESSLSERAWMGLPKGRELLPSQALKEKVKSYLNLKILKVK